MNKERFLELHKQYSEETAIYFFIKEDHLAYVELANIDLPSSDMISWTLERLKDSIGFDQSVEGIDNDPWLSLVLLGIYTNGKCFDGFLTENEGKLVETRDFVLRWGKEQELI